MKSYDSIFLLDAKSAVVRSELSFRDFQFSSDDFSELFFLKVELRRRSGSDETMKIKWIETSIKIGCMFSAECFG